MHKIIKTTLLLLVSYNFAFAGASLMTIEVDSPPDIDPDEYRRIAVLPFSSNDETFHSGIILARKITEAMDDKEAYLMESRETVFLLADDMDYDAASREDALETYDSSEIPLEEDKMDEIIKGLAAELADDYVYTLDSHKVEEKRYLISF